MSQTQPQPNIGWPLFSATADALATLRMHLPKGALRPDASGDGASKAEEHYVREWATALSGISLDAIRDAASRWLRDEELLDSQGRTRIPNIAAYARYARQVDFNHWRAPHLQLVQTPPVLSGRIHDLSTLALRAFGSRAHVEAVWGELFTRATAGAETQRVREGRVSDEEFEAAMATVRARLEAERAAVPGGHSA